MRITFDFFPGLGVAIGYTDDKFVILIVCLVITVDFGHYDFV